MLLGDLKLPSQNKMTTSPTVVHGGTTYTLTKNSTTPSGTQYSSPECPYSESAALSLQWSVNYTLCTVGPIHISSYSRTCHSHSSGPHISWYSNVSCGHCHIHCWCGDVGQSQEGTAPLLPAPSPWDRPLRDGG